MWIALCLIRWANFLLSEEINFNHKEVLILCLLKSHSTKYERECDIFMYDEVRDDSLLAYIFSSLSSSYEAYSSIPLSSSLKINPLPDSYKYALWGAH